MIRDLIENGSVLQIVATVIAFGLIVASVLSLVYIIVGGITFILSAGNEERIKKAGCFSSYLIADVKRHNQFRNKGYEEGSKRARQLTDSGQLVAFVAQACDAALAARREAVPVSR